MIKNPKIIYIVGYHYFKKGTFFSSLHVYLKDKVNIKKINGGKKVHKCGCAFFLPPLWSEHRRECFHSEQWDVVLWSWFDPDVIGRHHSAGFEHFFSSILLICNFFSLVFSFSPHCNSDVSIFNTCDLSCSAECSVIFSFFL